QFILNRCLYNANGMMINYYNATMDEQTTASYNNGFNVDGCPINSSVSWTSVDGSNISIATDTSNYTYFFFEASVLNLIQASRSNQYGTSHRNVNYFYNSNTA